MDGGYDGDAAWQHDEGVMKAPPPPVEEGQADTTDSPGDGDQIPIGEEVDVDTEQETPPAEEGMTDADQWQDDEGVMEAPPPPFDD